MKLRLRSNSLRLRINRRELELLAHGNALQEQVVFPDLACIAYVLAPSRATTPAASFDGRVIRVSAPECTVLDWANGDAVGLYFDLPANGTSLKITIEKDLECIGSPGEEPDPDAFPRPVTKSC